MKAYLANIIPKNHRFSKQLDDIVLLTNQHWVSLDDISQTKRVYKFDKNGDLDIYKDGGQSGPLSRHFRFSLTRKPADYQSI